MHANEIESTDTTPESGSTTPDHTTDTTTPTAEGDTASEKPKRSRRGTARKPRKAAAKSADADADAVDGIEASTGQELVEAVPLAEARETDESGTEQAEGDPTDSDEAADADDPESGATEADDVDSNQEEDTDDDEADEADEADDDDDDDHAEGGGDDGKPTKKRRERKELRRERFGVQTALEPPPFGPSIMLVEESVGDECRVAVLEEGRLSHYFAERESNSTNVGSIYKGRVANVEPAIQAAFIDFGQGQNGFLHVSDLHPKYFPGEEVTERVGKKIARHDRPMIQDALRRGQEIIVQVIKEGIGTKGPTVTSYISIPGRLLVMMPDMDKAGVSRKVADEDQRRAMRKILDSLDLPEGCGFILRTAGLDRSKSELQRDAAYLERLWTAMRKRIDKTGGPCELYTEGDLLIRTLRDLADPCIKSIVVDSPAAFDRAQIFLDIVAPGTGPKLHFWTKQAPLFTAFRVDEQVALIHAREVPLPSGGALVFDEAEALVAIDVNSGRSRSARDSETNAYQTNMEAVEEISRQLRLRDVGGLIINDLIDMRLPRHRRAVEERFAALLKRDRAKTTLLPISDLGMAEMTRQRMRPSQRKANYTACPHCHGSGEIRMPDVVVGDIVRHCAMLLSHSSIRRVEAVCSVRVASEMLGRGRRLINSIEDRSGKLVDVRISEAFAADRFEVYAYDERGADIEVERLPTMPRPIVSDLPTELSEELEQELDAESESPRRRRRRRKPAPADATAIALAGGFDDLPPIDGSETSLLETISRKEREQSRQEPRETRDREPSGRGRSRRERGRGGRERAEEQPKQRQQQQQQQHAPSRAASEGGEGEDGSRKRRGRRRRGPQQAILVPGEPVPMDRCETVLLARHYGVTKEELLARLRELVPADLEHLTAEDRHMLPCEVVHYVRLHFTPAPPSASAPVDAEEETGDDTPPMDGESGGLSPDGAGGGQRRRRRRRGGRGRRGQDGDAEGGTATDARTDGASEPREDRRRESRRETPVAVAAHAEAPAPAPGPAPVEPPAAAPGWKPLRSLYGAAMRRLRPGEGGSPREG